jgi:hypothetical protein
MSQIRVEHGQAEVILGGVETSVGSSQGVIVTYTPRDLMDATAATLLAVNTPQAVGWAHEIFRLTGGTQ